MLPRGITRSIEILELQNARAGRGRASVERPLRRSVEGLRCVGACRALVVTHAVNVFVRPRATADVESVVDAGRLDAVRHPLSAEFGRFEALDG